MSYIISLFSNNQLAFLNQCLANVFQRLMIHHDFQILFLNNSTLCFFIMVIGIVFLFELQCTYLLFYQNQKKRSFNDFAFMGFQENLIMYLEISICENTGSKWMFSIYFPSIFQERDLQGLVFFRKKCRNFSLLYPIHFSVCNFNLFYFIFFNWSVCMQFTFLRSQHPF